MGPTAVGKTAVAIAAAKTYSTAVISADSRQCYKELDIGVAKPSVEALKETVHYFINSHSIFDTVNAAVFEQYAIEKVNEIFMQNDVVIMAGGTGLYINAFCNGLDEVPETLPGLRAEIAGNYHKFGLAWLQEEVKKNDPAFYSAGEIQNPHRLMRALEVKLSTDKSIIEYQTRKKEIRNFDMIKIGLELPRPELYNRINQRVDEMISDGLVEEARQLFIYQDLNALQTVGYRELFDHFSGSTSLPAAIEAIKINTRHYAKRQMTWFKKDKDIIWCGPDNDRVLMQISKAMNSQMGI